MQSKYLNRLLQVTAITLTIVSTSCQKEPIEPRQTEAETNGTIIFIRAVEKDSTITNSEQIFLR